MLNLETSDPGESKVIPNNLATAKTTRKLLANSLIKGCIVSSLLGVDQEMRRYDNRDVMMVWENSNEKTVLRNAYLNNIRWKIETKMSKSGEDLDPEIGCDMNYDSIKMNYYEIKYQSNVSQVPPQYKPLTLLEKRFLLAVERGDLPAVRRALQETPRDEFNVNCCDPIGRSGLLMAIDNENLEMCELLVNSGVEMKDALLHAINEEFVEAVELLLDNEDQTRLPGQLHSWEAVERETFTQDITPLILAAHRNNYEILKIILDRGTSPIPAPHDARCGCKDCRLATKEDCLRHSRSRINAYKALCSPSLISLSSKDPILTAFELSWQLRRLSFLEPEFKIEYQELRRQCQSFATALLDHTRTTEELEVLLNYDPLGDPMETQGRMKLSRLKLAIRVKQKLFCAHANVQQLLASIWYEGLPGFRRKNIMIQTLQLLVIGGLFPLLSMAYIIAPHSKIGQFIKKPFIKFICHSASYVTFLLLLMLASQRIETDIFGNSSEKEVFNTTKRGALPSPIELFILAWVLGLIWSEIKQLWDLGITDYLSDMWNILDFITNSLYVATVALRFIAYLQIQKEIALKTGTASLPREFWDAFDPILLSEGLFAAANIFSSLKLVYIFSVNPHLGPLQISLGRMVIDILKFFSVYTLVLFSFACGMNQLLWYYADMEKQVCYLQQSGKLPKNQTDVLHPDACFIWRRFANLFESIQTLFWASFGLIDLANFELTGIQSYTRFWGLLMFGVYSTINVIVLLNLLIAMMNHSYQMISEQADKEWKFARSKLWMSYFNEGETVPPPFNIIPSPKSVDYLLRWLYSKLCAQTKKAKNEAMRTIRRKQRKASERDHKYQTVMRSLVRRYITSEQRIQERQRGVTEDDVNEVKQDISALRYELLEMLGNENKVQGKDGQKIHTMGKRGRQRERRLMKGFNFDVLLKDRTGSFDSDSTAAPSPRSPTKLKSSSSRSRFSRLTRGLGKRRSGGTGRWRQLIEATRNRVMPFSRSQESMSETVGSGSVSASGDTIANVGSSGRVGANITTRGSIPTGGPIPMLRTTPGSLKLDANVRRSIFARKTENLSESHANIDNRESPVSDSTDRSTIIVKKHSRNEWI